MTGQYPYTLQCYRGDVSGASYYCDETSSWKNFSPQGDCGVDPKGFYGSVLRIMKI